MDLAFAILLLSHIWTNCAAQNDFSACGQNIDLDEHRITEFYGSGSDPLGTWPWMVSVGYYNDGDWTHFCGGVIISRWFVISAAHCMTDDRLQIHLGTNNFNIPIGQIAARIKIREIAEIKPHPKYNPEAESAYYDIAVLRVDSSISFNYFIRPICMPSLQADLDFYAGRVLTVTGWGFPSGIAQEDKEDPNLQSLPIRLYAQSNCNKIHSANLSSSQEVEINQHLPKLFTPNIMCAGYEQPLYGPCKGHTGSPLVQYQLSPWRYVLRGLVRGGIGACGDIKFPAIVTRIDAEEILSFIESATIYTEEASEVPSFTTSNSSYILKAFSDTAEETLEVLLSPTQESDNPSPNLEVTNDVGETILMHFAKEDRLEAVQTLIEHEANVHHVNNWGMNALMLAAVRNSTAKMVQPLIDAGLNIHQPDFKGRNALHWAAVAGNLPMVETLLDKGLSIESKDRDNTTPLCLAVQAGKYRTVEYLLQQGADINSRTQKNQFYPIHFAISGSEGSSVLKLLVDHGADLESVDVIGVTPMIYAVATSFLNTTEQLYELGADVYALNVEGNTILHSAAFAGAIQQMRWLKDLDGGALLARYLDWRNNSGQTPLLFAVFGNQAEAVQELLTYGADRLIKDNMGRTALDWALINRNHAIYQLLQ